MDDEKKRSGLRMNDTKRLTVSDDGELLVDGKKLAFKHELQLSWWQSLAAIVAAGSALSMAILDALRFFCGN